MTSRVDVYWSTISIEQWASIHDVTRDGFEWRFCTQRNLFEILLNQTEIRLYLPCTDWFGTKRWSVWSQINRCMVNTIWFRNDLIRFRKYLSACRQSVCGAPHTHLLLYVCPLSIYMCTKPAPCCLESSVRFSLFF